MIDRKIHIPAKRVTPNEQGIIRISPEAYQVLADIANESGGSVRAVASTIILQAAEKELIVFDREE